MKCIFFDVKYKIVVEEYTFYDKEYSLDNGGNKKSSRTYKFSTGYFLYFRWHHVSYS